MKQKYKNIKSTKEFCFKQIEEANKTLKEIRERCDHPSSSKENYSWRIGSIEERMICDVCGELTDVPSWAVVKGKGLSKDAIKDDFKPGTIESWDDGGCSTGLGGDQYEENKDGLLPGVKPGKNY